MRDLENGEDCNRSAPTGKTATARGATLAGSIVFCIADNLGCLDLF